MNTYLKTLALVAVVGFAGSGLAVADQWDKKTTITINEPVQLPNTLLQPGTYVIRLVDLSGGSNRHTVQFFDKDEKHLITTILAIPNERVRPTGKSVFAFWETPAGQPQALRAWFYPGDNFGQEFAYPKDEAAAISARNNNVTVPINDDKSSADSSTTRNDSAVASTQPATQSNNNDAAPVTATAAQPAPVAQPVPAPAPVEVAQAQPAPAPADTNSDAQRVSPTPAPAAPALPQTASNLPLFALIGMLSMVAALALRFAYNRS